jgi:hypothetical protein
MQRTPLLLSAALLASACVVYTDDKDPFPEPDPTPANYAPYVLSAEAGCYWDPSYRDYVWTFDADVDDPNGWGDVFEVWADVYDDTTGAWVDSFYLNPVDEFYWSSAWLQASTWLDAAFPYYVIDFVPYDYSGASSVASVLPLRCR